MPAQNRSKNEPVEDSGREGSRPLGQRTPLFGHTGRVVEVTTGRAGRERKEKKPERSPVLEDGRQEEKKKSWKSGLA